MIQKLQWYLSKNFHESLNNDVLIFDSQLVIHFLFHVIFWLNDLTTYESQNSTCSGPLIKWLNFWNYQKPVWLYFQSIGQPLKIAKFPLNVDRFCHFHQSLTFILNLYFKQWLVLNFGMLKNLKTHRYDLLVRNVQWYLSAFDIILFILIILLCLHVK